jgi:hypothetical protein
MSGQAGSEVDAERRAILSGLVAVCLATVSGAASAQTGTSHEVFLNLSRRLTGRATLDAEQGARLFEAFAGVTPDFETAVQQLLAWMNERKVDIGQLQQALDAEGSPLAGLPRQIMRAWYTGVVGEGGATRCVTFETSLMNRVVADRLNPPSYCYGPHGSWGNAPA